MTRSPFGSLAALTALLALLAVSLVGPAAPAQAQGTDVVLAKSIPLDSKILKRRINVLVYVPPGYAQSAARYPVLYDLNTFFCFTYDCGTVEMLARTQDIPSMIVVGVPQLNAGYVPTPLEERGDTLAGADLSIKFFKDELIPLVEQNYRTNAARLLYGHSVGGLFTMYALFNYPDVFTGYLAGSPWFQNNQQYWLKNIEKLAKERTLKDKCLYMTVGKGETQLTLDTYAGLEEWMKAQQLPGLQWKSALVEGDHGSMVGRTIYDGLLFVFDGWKIPNALVMAGDIDAIDAHAQKTAAKWSALGFDATAILSEANVNAIGYNLIQRKEYDKALKVFQYNVRRSPKSYNALDSLAEAYQTMGERANAIKHYKLAVELNPGSSEIEKRILQNSKDKLIELGAEK
jgi:predicted alpha/beta superfamily hydrolase